MSEGRKLKWIKGQCKDCPRPAVKGGRLCKLHRDLRAQAERDRRRLLRENNGSKEDAAGTEVADPDAANSESEGSQDQTDGKEFSGGESTDTGEDDSDMDGAAHEQLDSCF